jgi:hypothetical protein
MIAFNVEAATELGIVGTHHNGSRAAFFFDEIDHVGGED